MTMTDSDDVGKLFVGGLSWETTKENLHSYFSKFGEVVDCVVMKNNETGRSRGFGFVTFKDPNCVTSVLQTKPHELNGRTVDPKECTPRSMQQRKTRPGPGQAQGQGGQSSPGKVFLGGLPPDVTETDVRNALSKFGKVSQVMIMCDQETKKCRGFGFLSFESEDSIDRACAERFVNINGKQIECKRAEPRDNYRRPPGQQYNSYPGGNQNGRQSSYGPGPMNPSGYQPGWSSHSQQPYAAQGNAYGSYQSASPGAPYSAPSAAPYNSTPPSQYAQPGYSSYGSEYNYSQMPPNNYSQAPAGGYSQPPASGYSQAPANNYSAAPPSNYSQPAPTGYSTMGSSNYSQAAPVTPEAKVPGMPTGSYGASYGNPVAASTRGQGYHPYRR